MKRMRNNPDSAGGFQIGQMTENDDGLTPDTILNEAIEQERHKRNWVQFIIEIMIVVIAVLLVFRIVIGMSQVSGDSMSPAFEEKDRVIYFRLAQTYEKGDVILFRTDSGEVLLKRIIASEGQSVYVDPKKKRAFIDGVQEESRWVYTDTEITDESVVYPVVMGEDSFFVMGDNRESSEDSRSAKIGQVSKKQIIGKVFFVMRGI